MTMITTATKLRAGWSGF